MSIENSITINAHSSIRIAGERVVYFDPFELTSVPHDADVIFFTHDHYDHYSPEDVARVSKPGTVLVCPSSVSIPGAVTFAPGEKGEVSGLPVEAVPAYNIERTQFHAKSKSWLGYVVTFGAERVYVCGDTECTPEAKAVRCDVLLCPAGGKYTMDYREAAELANAISPRVAIPTHYGSIVGSKTDGASFAKLVLPPTKVEFRI